MSPESIYMIQKTLENFKAFLKNAKEKSYLNRNTAQNWSIALKKFEPLLTDIEKEDLTLINEDTLFTQFNNRYHNHISPSSFGTYQSRFTSALSNFFKYANDPKSYKPRSNTKSKTKKTNTYNAQLNNEKQQKITTPKPQEAKDKHSENPYINFNIHIPLSKQDARFQIPSDLSDQQWGFLMSTLLTTLEIYKTNPKGENK